jgi:hypothetical protein
LASPEVLAPPWQWAASAQFADSSIAIANIERPDPGFRLFKF